MSPVVVAGRYRLGATLGEGGMGRVLLARDEVLDRDVAIKEIVLPENLTTADRAMMQQRTLREARAAARISHPHAAQVYDVIAADGSTWIVMEYVPSRSLRQVLAEQGPLDPRRVAEIGLAVLGALDAAHRAGVRHRDVKPANVLLGDDGRVVLTDFGIATIEGDGIETSADLVVGSPQYMSPERVRDGTTLPASDLWSLGATLYTAVEGHSPYERGSVFETLSAVAADEPTRPQRAGVLAPVLDGLLRKDPTDRIDVDRTRDLLEEALAGVPERRTRWPWRPRPATTPPETAETAVVPRRRVPAEGHTPDPRRRRYGLVAGAAAAVVLGGAATGWLVLRAEPDVLARVDATTRPSASAARPAPPDTTPASQPAVPSRSPVAESAAAPSRTPALPAGWRAYRDPTGFRVYVPSGWRKSKEHGIVYFRSSRGEVLGIDQTDTPRSDPVADWQGKARYRVSIGDFPGYDQIRIKSVPYFRKAADWEFTFDGSTRQHVNNRGFVVSGKLAYGIYWQTTDARWQAGRDDLQLVFDSFRPASPKESAVQ